MRSVHTPARFLTNDRAFRSPSPGQALGVYSAGFMLKPALAGSYLRRSIPEFVVVYVLRGRGEFVDFRRRRFSVTAGQMILMPARKPHSVVQNPDGQWAECYLTLDGDFGKMLERTGVIDPRRPVLEPGISVSLIEPFARITNGLKSLPDARLPQLFVDAHEMLVAAAALDRKAREPDATVRVIERVCDALAADPNDRLDLPQLADSLGLQYEALRKLFKQRIGLSPGEYRIRRRIDQARARLANFDLSVAEIAYSLGYRDPFIFSKQFKRFVGTSPAEFRRRL